MVEVSWPRPRGGGGGQSPEHMLARGHTFLGAGGGVAVCVSASETAGVCLLGLSVGLSTGSPSTHTPPERLWERVLGVWFAWRWFRGVTR